MTKTRVLLSTEDLKELYKLTNPKLPNKPRLNLVKREKLKDWSEENTFSMRGYRACQSYLASCVKKYESQGLWPQTIELGIGVYESDTLSKVLMAVDRGFIKDQEQPKRPLDVLLESVHLTRKDLKK